jgi:hypothetical protein
MAFVNDIAPWLTRVFPALGHKFTTNMTILLVLSAVMIAFDFFNTFVTAIFWYLFNDVVPEELISRFTSWFRMIIMVTGMIYNVFVFPYVETDYKEILVGAALLYFVGFTTMCLFVKEGQYPPPPKNTDRKTGLISSLKTYARECMTLPHYWYLYLWGIFGTIGGACGMFGIFFSKISMGLNLHQIGWLGFAGAATAFVWVPIAGWMGDRFHPLRVVLWGNTLANITAPIGLIWLFWRPGPTVYFWFTLIQTVSMGCPIGMLCQMDFPMLMRVMPRERFGQYCSCRVFLTSFVGILVSPVGGYIMDVLTKHFGEKTAYCFINYWSFPFNLAGLFFFYMFFYSWKRYGGDESYVAPIPAHLKTDAVANEPHTVILP